MEAGVERVCVCVCGGGVEGGVGGGVGGGGKWRCVQT